MRKHLSTLAAVVLMVSTGCSADTGQGGEQATTAVTDTSVAADTTAEPAGELTSVTLRTDFAFNGYNVPYAVADTKGFYEDAGLNVSIENGDGSATTIQTIANGNDDFGIADAGLLARAITNESVPVKSIGVYLQRNPLGLAHRPDEFSGDIQEIRGMVLIGCPGCPGTPLMELIMEREGIPQSEVDSRLIDGDAMIPTFLQTENSLMNTFGPGLFVRARIQDSSLEFISLAEYGMDVYSTGLITSTDMIENNPDVVEAFLEASTRGWEYAMDNPDEAVSIAVEGYSDFDAEVLSSQFELSVDLLHTDATADLPLGVTAEEDWQSMLETFEATGALTSEIKSLDQYFDNSFLPGQ